MVPGILQNAVVIAAAVIVPWKNPHTILLLKTSANIQQIQMSNHKLKDKKLLLEGNESLKDFMYQNTCETPQTQQMSMFSRGTQQRDKTPPEPGLCCFKQQRRDGESMEGGPNHRSDSKT